MFTATINSHSTLQELANKLVRNFYVDDGFVLHSAIIEVLQNTVQHSNGQFAFEVKKDHLIITNLIKNNGHTGAGLGLQLFSGIYTHKQGDLFYTFIFPDKVRIMELNIEEIMEDERL
ncbi:MAG: hypothetical protein K8T10_01690 [Candidatus Eremiobacteraeota bacterium]|nr:hypothetical protein [Candidatus Eremiobacteraeota bacterium]